MKEIELGKVSFSDELHDALEKQLDAHKLGMGVPESLFVNPPPAQFTFTSVNLDTINKLMQECAKPPTYKMTVQDNLGGSPMIFEECEIKPCLKQIIAVRYANGVVKNVFSKTMTEIHDFIRYVNTGNRMYRCHLQKYSKGAVKAWHAGTVHTVIVKPIVPVKKINLTLKIDPKAVAKMRTIE